MTSLKVVQIDELAFKSETRNTDIGRIILIHFIEVVNFEKRKPGRWYFKRKLFKIAEFFLKKVSLEKR